MHDRLRSIQEAVQCLFLFLSKAPVPMDTLGSPSQPLRVAIIGAGPAGFYAADHLLKQDDVTVGVDLFDRLPTPFGLVRGGVAPDHQKIKNVSRVFDKVARNNRFCFFGNVELGTHVTVEDLRRYYHALLYATGAQTDRNLNIPGENLEGSHSATEFVAWYNGHPDYRNLEFDLSRERVAIIGVGNVAVDVARILCRTTEELARTDIADYALEALRESSVREVYMLGRRGPAQAAFTNPEIKELGELSGADVTVPEDEAELDALSADYLEEEGDRMTRKKVQIIQELAERPLEGRPRKLTLRFLVSPTEFLDDGTGHVGGMRLVHNELYEADSGRLRPRGTDETETLPVDLVFRSIGYTGVPLPGVPFYERWGIIPNEAGRVLDAFEGEQVVGEYVAGWIKRGATGVIGTNKPDAVETADSLLEDARQGRVLQPEHPEHGAIAELIEARQPDWFSYEDWLCLNEIEVARGEEQGRPRVKFTSIDEMVEAVREVREQQAAG